MNCTYWISWMIFSNHVKRQFSCFAVWTFSCNKMAKSYSFYCLLSQWFCCLFTCRLSLRFLNVVHDNLISLLKFCYIFGDQTLIPEYFEVNPETIVTMYCFLPSSVVFINGQTGPLPRAYHCGGILFSDEKNFAHCTLNFYIYIHYTVKPRFACYVQ